MEILLQQKFTVRGSPLLWELHVLEDEKKCEV